jgi:Resolvase, N terminal domain
VDTGISGTKDRRPALDQLLSDIAARRIDAVVCWRLDRFGRNLRHLIVTIEELTAAGVAFVSMGESIDTGSPTGRLLLGILGSFAEFERERIRERITAGLARARRQGTNLVAAGSGSLFATLSGSPGCQYGRPRRRSAFRRAGFTVSAPGYFRIMASSTRKSPQKPRPRRLPCSRFGIS